MPTPAPDAQGPSPEPPARCYGDTAGLPLRLKGDSSNGDSNKKKLSRSSSLRNPSRRPSSASDVSSSDSLPTMNSFANLDTQVQILRRQIEATESQLHSLKSQLEKAEQDAQEARDVDAAFRGGIAAGWIDETLQVLQQHEQGDTIQRILFESQASPTGSSPPPSLTRRRWPLETQEYSRYGRQLIMPQIGLFGQLKLKAAKILIVGLGGLGSPAAAYLAGAGVGTLGLMDGDKVEVSNLHRQIAHSTLRVDMSKVDSAYEYLQGLNPRVSYNRYRFHLTPDRAIQTVEEYDLVVDCTDHPTSRYLISDACVLTGKPLVTASALKTEGQLMVLNNPPRPPGDPFGGPCYRCIFPKPPPPESVLSCGEGGILGPVVGVMGVLQALEAIKVLTGSASVGASSPAAPDTPVSNLVGPGQSINEPENPTLIMFSAYSSPQFRTVRLRARRPDGCAACSGLGSITRESMLSGSLDYVAFCGMASPINILPSDARISASEFADLRPDGTHVLIDVRDETQFTICALRGSINVPWTGDGETWLQQAAMRGALNEDGKQRYVVCRVGNDSQLAARAMMERMENAFNIMDIRGGFRAWREEVDNEWPDY